MIDAEQRDERTTTQTNGKATCCAPYQSHGQKLGRMVQVIASGRRGPRQAEDNSWREQGGRLIDLHVLRREQNLRMNRTS